MADFTPPTYEQPVGSRLGQHGIAFPVGKIVFICEADEAHETTLVMGNFSAQECSHGETIRAGTGDNDLALFRRGKTYSVSASEETILTNAGYTVA